MKQKHPKTKTRNKTSLLSVVCILHAYTIYSCVYMCKYMYLYMYVWGGWQMGDGSWCHGHVQFKCTAAATAAQTVAMQLHCFAVQYSAPWRPDMALHYGAAVMKLWKAWQKGSESAEGQAISLLRCPCRYRVSKLYRFVWLKYGLINVYF